MSSDAVSWAFDQEVASTQKFLLVAIADHANPSGVCFPGQERLQMRTGLRSSTVTKGLKFLEAEGFLARAERRRRDGFRSSDWTVLAPHRAAHERLPLKPAPEQEDYPDVVRALFEPKKPAPISPVSDTDELQGTSPVPVSAPHLDLSAAPHLDHVQGLKSDEPSVIEPSEEPTAERSLSSRSELLAISTFMAEQVLSIDGKAPVDPHSDMWLAPLAVLFDEQHRTEDEIRSVIEWVVGDDFNRQVVLAPAKLAERFTELAVRAGVSEPKDNGLMRFKFQQRQRSVPDAANFEITGESARRAAEEHERMRPAIEDHTNHEPVLEAYIGELRPVTATDDVLVLGARPAFARFVAERYGRLLSEIAGKTVQVIAQTEEAA